MRLGDVEIQVISGGKFWLDGGGMFGVVPRVLWRRRYDTDERNRVQLDTNCALIRTPEALVLCDAGNGGKLGEKDRDIFGLTPGDDIEASLAAAGIARGAITHVIFSHLHLDHCGGGVRREDGRLVPAFPQARYFVQRRELDDALAMRSHMKITYRDENYQPLLDAGVLQALNGDAEIVPGVRVRVTGGHTPGHQLVFIESGGRTAVYGGDVCPTQHHLAPMWNMAFDLDPLGQMRNKAELLPLAADADWVWLFAHDPEIRFARIVREGDHYVAAPLE